MLARLAQAALLTFVFHLWMSLSTAPNAAPTASRSVLPQLASLLSDPSTSPQ